MQNLQAKAKCSLLASQTFQAFKVRLVQVIFSTPSYPTHPYQAVKYKFLTDDTEALKEETDTTCTGILTASKVS